MNEGHLTYLASPDWARRLETELLPWIESVASLGDDLLEVGPGPGLTTDILRQRTASVTAVEIDDALATALADRLAGTNVNVIHGDAATLPFEAGRFSAATAFSVLHHVPTAEQQDQILREIVRVLAPGAGFFAVDTRDLEPIREGHRDDTFNPLDPDSLVRRLEGLGFARVDLEIDDYQIRFAAYRS